MKFEALWIEEVGHPPSNAREARLFANARVLFGSVPNEIVRRYIRKCLGV